MADIDQQWFIPTAVDELKLTAATLCREAQEARSEADRLRRVARQARRMAAEMRGDAGDRHREADKRLDGA